MNTCTVKFPNNNTEYSYMYPAHWEVFKGSLVVVHTPSGEYKLCKVVRTHEGRLKRATKRIVDLVDKSEYKEWLEVERERKDLEDAVRARAEQVINEIHMDELIQRDSLLESLVGKLRQFGK